MFNCQIKMNMTLFNGGSSLTRLFLYVYWFYLRQTKNLIQDEYAMGPL